MDFFAVTQLQFQTDGLLTNFNKRSFLTPLLLILCDTFSGARAFPSLLSADVGLRAQQRRRFSKGPAGP